jgi:hypothetical protein
MVFHRVVGLSHSHVIRTCVGRPLTYLILTYHECFVWDRFLSVSWVRRTWLRRTAEAICFTSYNMTATSFLLIIYDYSHLLKQLNSFKHLYRSFDISHSSTIFFKSLVMFYGSLSSSSIRPSRFL